MFKPQRAGQGRCDGALGKKPPVYGTDANPRGGRRPLWGVPNSMKGLIRYLSGLRVTQGRRAGEHFAVLPWQRRFVRHAFAPGVQSAALSVARGNGKTALLSGIAAATLDGPLAVRRGETVIVASSFEQARIAFEHVVAFMGAELEDKGRWRVWDTAQQARVEDKQTGARVRCIGSDPRRAQGLAPVLVLADEPAQWPETTGERMVAALRDSGRQAAAFALRRARHPARRRDPLVREDAGWWRGLRPMPRGSGRRAEVPQNNLAEGEPEPATYARPAGSHPVRGATGQTRPCPTRQFRGAAVEPWNRGRRVHDAPGRGPVAVYRGRGGTGRPSGMGN